MTRASCSFAAFALPAATASIWSFDRGSSGAAMETHFGCPGEVRARNVGALGPMWLRSSHNLSVHGCVTGTEVLET